VEADRFRPARAVLRLPEPSPGVVPSGAWRGGRAELLVSATEARLDAGCLVGLAGPLTLDRDGRFDTPGRARFKVPPDVAARFFGRLGGGRLTLQVQRLETGAVSEELVLSLNGAWEPLPCRTSGGSPLGAGDARV
jgi:hypothetical protein